MYLLKYIQVWVMRAYLVLKTTFVIKSWILHVSRALVRPYFVYTDSDRITGRLWRYNYGQFTSARIVTLIRGETEGCCVFRRDETFLIISRLMKPRAIKFDLCTRSCIKKERGRDRQTPYISPLNSPWLLHVAGSCWLSWRQFLPPSFWQISTAVYVLSYVLR